MSYDDGSEHDRRLVEIFNRYGIRGTFHLNSGKLDRAGHVHAGEIGSLYAGHEIACHTVSHPCLTDLDDDAIVREVRDDRSTLEKLTGRPVRGLAYPFGAYDKRVSRLLPGLGIEYARTVEPVDGFRVPDDFLRLATTCHHNAAMDRIDDFLARDDAHWHVMIVWGHSYELDGFMSSEPGKDWNYMESLCHRMEGRDDVCALTLIEMVDCIRAVQGLRRMEGRNAVENPGRDTVWIRCGGSDIRIPPGAVVAVQD